MTNSKHSSTKHSARLSNWLVLAFFLVSLIGFADAAYLSVMEVSGRELSCSVTNGCGVVTGSSYSKIAGIPVAFLGAGYYLILFLSTVLYYDRQKIHIMKYAALCTGCGFVMSLWFIYVQGFILHAWCQYCLLSAATSTTLFGLGLLIMRQINRLKNTTNQTIPSTRTNLDETS